MKALKLLTALFIVLSSMATANAQTWPDKPVKLVVPYPAGGGVDPVARLIGQKLADRWKQPVIVENKPGASGSIGASFVAHSAPDGLTIMMSATAEVAINQFFMKDMSYNPETDLKPVTLVVRLPFVLVTNTSHSYSTIAELIAHAKKNPHTVTYASSGIGTPQHLAGVLLEQLSGIQLIHVPYKGVAPAISDLLAGHVDIGFVGLPTGLPYIQTGALKALGVSSKTATPGAPSIPPLAATQALHGFDLNQWFGVFVPKGTPDTVVKRIQHDISDVLRMPDIKEALEKQGAQPSGMSTADFSTFLASERDKFKIIVKNAKLQQ